ncbi:unnamed protein product [Bursaphelenchus xylophilus]|uniref:(pine wood nematode) hypothetical protein n=1 Tax=Bursaphelenchus xylophilus TaxID=6326 RepID=A0A1I7SCI1_BURXY|nr:unnamed protein product [Bursaphelenchus xylophilus]CAG9094061.1 unnamed protein product [Bursaphelenchus xylophilus]
MNGRCAQCKHKIEERTAVYANGKVYHTGHFRCSLCDLKINDYYVLEDENNLKSIICLHCQANNKSPKCNECKLAISETYVQAKGKPFHMDCLLCGRCRQPFPGGEFYELNGEFFDANCYWAARLRYETTKIEERQDENFEEDDSVAETSRISDYNTVMSSIMTRVRNRKFIFEKDTESPSCSHK